LSLRAKIKHMDWSLLERDGYARRILGLDRMATPMPSAVDAESYGELDWGSPSDVLDHIRDEGVWLLLLASGKAPIYRAIGLLVIPLFQSLLDHGCKRVGSFRIDSGESRIFKNTPLQRVTLF
jgi:hypothetical protein